MLGPVGGLKCPLSISIPPAEVGKSPRDLHQNPKINIQLKKPYFVPC